MTKIKDMALIALVLLVGLETGFLAKLWWDYTHGPVPMITPSELVSMLEE